MFHSAVERIKRRSELSRHTYTETAYEFSLITDCSLCSVISQKYFFQFILWLNKGIYFIVSKHFHAARNTYETVSLIALGWLILRLDAPKLHRLSPGDLYCAPKSRYTGVFVFRLRQKSGRRFRESNPRHWAQQHNISTAPPRRGSSMSPLGKTIPKTRITGSRPENRPALLLHLWYWMNARETSWSNA